MRKNWENCDQKQEQVFKMRNLPLNVTHVNHNENGPWWISLSSSSIKLEASVPNKWHQLKVKTSKKTKISHSSITGHWGDLGGERVKSAERGRHWWLITTDFNRKTRLSGPETLAWSRLNANKDLGSSLLHMWEPRNVRSRRLVSGERPGEEGEAQRGLHIGCLSDIPARWTPPFLSVSPWERRPASSPRYLRVSTLRLSHCN